MGAVTAIQDNSQPRRAILVVLLLFVLPHSIFSIIPSSFNSVFNVVVVLGYCSFMAIHAGLFARRIYWAPLLFTASFVIFSILSSIAHQSFSFFQILIPVISYFGIVYLYNRRLDLSLFPWLFLLMYVYYFFVYYMNLPDLFFRPFFDEDAAVFDNSSSNAIPISLNLTLYSWFILNRLYRRGQNRQILFFAIVNMGLVLIQQSRGGILLSFLILIIALYEYNSRMFRYAILTGILAAIILITYNSDAILTYIEVVGSFDGVSALSEDVRGMAQVEFFHKLDLFSFFFGYPKDFVYTLGTTGEIKYTYNVFLDLWSRYTIFQLIIVLSVLLFRFLFHRRYEFPFYYFIPFLLYSLVESLFFPNHWDVVIYLLLFTTKHGAGKMPTNRPAEPVLIPA